MSELTAPEIELAAGLSDEVVVAHQEGKPTDPDSKGSLLVWMLTLALPVLLEESLNLSVSFTDRYLAGRFLGGPDPQAAMGLMMYAQWLLYCSFFSVAVGGTALTARFVGSGDLPLARQVTGQAIFAGTLLAAIVTAIAALFGSQCLQAMGATGETAVLAERYLWYLTPVIPIMMLEQVGTACLRGAGDTVTGLVARGIVNVVNVILSAGFVTGWGPFHQLGWDGLALGTSLGHAFGGLIILAALCRRSQVIRLERGNLLPNRSLLVRLMRVGIPGGLDMLAMVGLHFVYLRIISSLGNAALAAHSLGIQIEALAFLSGSSFQVAAATMAGQSLGANNPKQARQGVLLATTGAVLVMGLAGLLFYFGGEFVASFFTGGVVDETSHQAGELLKIVAWSVVPMAILIVLSGAMRGVGDTRWNLAINLLGIILIRLPLAVYWGWSSISIPGWEQPLAAVGWGVEGIWWAMVADVVTRCVIITGRFLHGGWLKVKV